MLDNLIIGFQTMLQLDMLLYCLIGVTLGTFVGVLPGIGSLAAMSLLLPLTYHIDPLLAIIMLAGIYYGAEYGGSTSSILLNLPGTTSAAVTCIDGYPMTRNGKAGVALFMTTIASLSGAMVGLFAVTFFSGYISQVGTKFGPAEYFSLIFFALIASSTVMSADWVKGLSMVILGLLLATIGVDPVSGSNRFTFNSPYLLDGISLVVLAIGLFGVVEIVKNANRSNYNIKQKITIQSMIPSKQEFKSSIGAMSRGSVIGGFIGALPGVGAAIASFIAYTTEKRISRNPEIFGKGAIEGVVAPESANNAAVQASFIPTLALGIPGTVTASIILGALTIHGIQPGPMFIHEQPILFWGLIASFLIGNIILIILNIPLIGVWVSFLKIPYQYLYPAILIFMSVGIYSISNIPFNILMLAIVGCFSYLLFVLKFEPAPLLLGFVLGPLMEENLRRSLTIAQGDISIFLSKPISATFLSMSALILLYFVLKLVHEKTVK
jgi:putative tricarboxylic transport membrane protein